MAMIPLRAAAMRVARRVKRVTSPRGPMEERGGRSNQGWRAPWHYSPSRHDLPARAPLLDVAVYEHLRAGPFKPPGEAAASGPNIRGCPTAARRTADTACLTSVPRTPRAGTLRSGEGEPVATATKA